MKRQFLSFPVVDFQETKLNLLRWAAQFDHCCFLDNQGIDPSEPAYECLVGAGAMHELAACAGSAFGQVQQFHDVHKDWLFGHFAYDLKNEVERLSSAKPDGIGFPDLSFFVPKVIIELRKETISIGLFGNEQAKIFQEIVSFRSPNPVLATKLADIQGKFSRDLYLQTVGRLREHILLGDSYEINFCQEFYCNQALIDPLQTYIRLSNISPVPHAALYKLGDRWALCASPERFLKKTGRRVLSSPMKGTAPRNLLDTAKDLMQKQNLFNSAKERAENIMIVDLVRNDLSKICQAGSVEVDELFGVYSFPLVHQMISTVSGKLTDGCSWSDAVRAAFPMGSMTGAPKRRAMELIEQYELSRRGLFSGAIGWISPEADFDFNVVIRTMLYNQASLYLSYQVGSAITFASDPEQEYQECLLKASAINATLQSNKGPEVFGSSRPC